MKLWPHFYPPGYMSMWETDLMLPDFWFKEWFLMFYGNEFWNSTGFLSAVCQQCREAVSDPSVSRDQLATPYSWCAANGDLYIELGECLEQMHYRCLYVAPFHIIVSFLVAQPWGRDVVRPPWTWCGYAGWSMPVQYSDLSIANSCLHTRSRASIFDVVSHMLQVQLYH